MLPLDAERRARAADHPGRDDGAYRSPEDLRAEAESIVVGARRSAEAAISAADERRGVVDVVCALLERGALRHLRSAQGVLGLAERHGAERLEAACRRALAVGDPAYRSIKGILAAGTEAGDGEASTVPIAPAHLHGAEGLFAHLGVEAG